MKLILVYNADSGLLNQVIQSGHKILRPSTYPCSLCQLTHHSFGERSIWKEFRKNHNLKFEFLHKNEFESQKKKGIQKYPFVFYTFQTTTKTLLSPEDLDKLQNTEELINAISDRLNTIQNK